MTTCKMHQLWLAGKGLYVLVIQILILAVLFIVVPIVVGGLFEDLSGGMPAFLFCWVSGQVCLWAGFLVISVPMILMKRSLGETVLFFMVYAVALLLISVVLGIKRRTKKVFAFWSIDWKGKKDIAAICLWCGVVLLLLIQMILVGVLAYEEGDDAFYVAVSTITAKYDTMYRVLPYTGGSTRLDIRHGLASFPIWIAMFSRLSGIHAAILAQIVFPVILIMMSYAIYFQISRRLFPEGTRKRPLFMLFLEILVLFGGTSLYTAENFLLVRTAQGKAVLANIIIPFLFLLFLMLLENMQENKRLSLKYWVLVMLTMTAGCLCSTQGALITCVLAGAVGFCTAISYRRWKILFPMLGCCIVPACMACLYLVLR